MNKITFRNGEQPAINDINLNQLQINVEKAIDGIVIYERDETQTTSNVTFNKNLTTTNCKRIKIIFQDEHDVFGEQDVVNPVDKQANLLTFRNGSAGFIMMNTIVTISATGITINSNKKYTFSNSSYSDASTKITKVIAYF